MNIKYNSLIVNGKVKVDHPEKELVVNVAMSRRGANRLFNLFKEIEDLNNDDKKNA